MISTEKTEKQEEMADLSAGIVSGRPLAVHNSYQPLTTWACQPRQQSLLITITPHIDCSADTTHCSLYLMHPMAVLRGSQGSRPLPCERSAPPLRNPHYKIDCKVAWLHVFTAWHRIVGSVRLHHSLNHTLCHSEFLVPQIHRSGPTAGYHKLLHLQTSLNALVNTPRTTPALLDNIASHEAVTAIHTLDCRTILQSVDSLANTTPGKTLFISLSRNPHHV